MKNEIFVHCSATKPSMDIGRDVIYDWHVNQNGWSDIGYNTIIRRDGTEEGGRDLDNDGNFYEETGAHAKGFNTGSIGICLIGGVNDKGQPDSNFTFEQYCTLLSVIKKIRKIYGHIPVRGHRDVSSKACPSFNVQALLGEDL